MGPHSEVHRSYPRQITIQPQTARQDGRRQLACRAAIYYRLRQRGPSFGNNFNNRTEEALGLAADSQMAVERGLFGRLKPWFGFVMLVERAKGSLGAVRVPSNMPFPADTIFNSASYIDRYRIFFERMVTEGNYDAVALLTAEAESAEYVEPSASLSLANLEAAIRARIAYIKALPDDVFDELTTT